MNALSPENGVQIEPRQYEVAALEPILRSPEVAAATVREYEIVFTVGSIVEVGRAALKLGGVEPYRDWCDYTRDYIDTVQQRFVDTDYNPVNEYRGLAELYFHGAASGNFESAQKLHGMMENDSADASLFMLMALCDTYDVAPNVWIEGNAKTPDAIASNWGAYLSKRDQRIKQLGRLPQAEDMMVPGVAQHVNNFINGKLSLGGTIGNGTSMLHLVPTIEQKKAVYARYEQVMDQVLYDDNGISYRSAISMINFAKEVSTSDLPLVMKEELADRIRDEVPEWEDVSFQKARAELEMSMAIVQGAGMAELADMMDAILEQVEHPYTMREMRDEMLQHIAKAYAETNNLNLAASAVSKINSTRNWQSALNDYALHGGDISMAMLADEMRAMTDPQGGDEEETAYGFPEWEIRASIASISLAMQQGSFEAAEAGILDFARQAQGSSVYDTHLYAAAERLIAANPPSARIGTELVEIAIEAEGFGYRKQLSTLLGAHNAPGVRDAFWAYTQEQSNDAITYLHYYAGALLAEAQIAK